MILNKILKNKRLEVRDMVAAIPFSELKRRAAKAQQPLDFKEAISRGNDRRLKVIAETKKQSPSSGLLAADFDPQDTALKYVQGGAAAVSVLTEERFFGGSLSHLEAVRKVCLLPLLAKDFIIHPYQVYMSRCVGADAVLLITRILGQQQLGELYGLVLELGMDALVEVHDEKDMERALKINAKIIGINNRDLGDFSLNLAVTERLIKQYAPQGIIVSASGINTREDMEFLEGLPVDAVLVGSALMRSPHPEKDLRMLRGGKGIGTYQDVRDSDCC